MTIGKLAKAAGVNVETLRYYQRIGLVEQPHKPKIGYRCYPASTTNRIIFIKLAKELGFSLSEIAGLLSLGDRKCSEARSIAVRKQDTIRRRIQDLSSLQNDLGRLIDACQEDSAGQEHCAIIEALSKPLKQ